MENTAPWFSSYADTPRSLEYPDISMYLALERTAAAHPDKWAYEYMGFRTRYKEMLRRVKRCAGALSRAGVKKGDRVTICMPNMPQAIDMFYAVNRLGAVANMVHPLSAEREIEFCLNDSGSVCALTLDLFADKFRAVRENVKRLRTLIVCGAEDNLPLPVKLGYRLKEMRKRRRPGGDEVSYEDFVKNGEKISLPECDGKAADDAVVLYSGGTTGESKGILLDNNGFNAIALQVVSTNPMFRPGDKMLAVLPIFHGFGLAVCVHAMMANGGCSILVPRFTLAAYARLLKKRRPNFIAGVPTLYEALIRLEDVKKLDLSYLKGVYSGGDTLGAELKERIDAFLLSHKSPVRIREGYGLTECIAVSCLTPYHTFKKGSIGIPLPDMYLKICAAGSENALPYGEEGEICVSGPTVMRRYVNNEQETKKTLRLHSDGRIWLHTGDLGVMDSDGYVYFRQRIKRMIVTSGYNVYPSAIEKLLDEHPGVHMSCVVGVDDPYRIKKVKAFIVPAEGVKPNEDTKKEILAYLRTRVAKYAMPREIEFRNELPMTRMNKIHYRSLEKEG